MYLLGIYLTTPTYSTIFQQTLPNTLETSKHSIILCFSTMIVLPICPFRLQPASPALIVSYSILKSPPLHHLQYTNNRAITVNCIKLEHAFNLLSCQWGRGRGQDRVLFPTREGSSNCHILISCRLMCHDCIGSSTRLDSAVTSRRTLASASASCFALLIYSPHAEASSVRRVPCHLSSVFVLFSPSPLSVSLSLSASLCSILCPV